jgi:hypothetical protein
VKIERTARIESPRLAHPAQADDFIMEISKADADVRRRAVLAAGTARNVVSKHAGSTRVRRVNNPFLASNPGCSR